MKTQGLFALLAWIAVCGAAFAQSGGLEVFSQAVEMQFPQGYDLYSDAGKVLKTVPGPTSATIQAKAPGKAFAAGEVYLSDWSYEQFQKGKSPNWIVPKSNSAATAAPPAAASVGGSTGLVVYPAIREVTFPEGYNVFSDDGQPIKTVPGPTSIALKGETGGKAFANGLAYLSDWSYDQLQQGKSPNWVVEFPQGLAESSDSSRSKPQAKLSEAANSEGAPIATVQTVNTDVSCADVSLKLGMLALSCKDEQFIRLYDLKTGKLIRKFMHDEPVLALAFVEEADQLLVAARYYKLPIKLTKYSLMGNALEKFEVLEKGDVSAYDGYKPLEASKRYGYNAIPIFCPRTGILKIFDYETLYNDAASNEERLSWAHPLWIDTGAHYRPALSDSSLDDIDLVPVDILSKLSISRTYGRQLKSSRYFALPNSSSHVLLATGPHCIALVNNEDGRPIQSFNDELMQVGLIRPSPDKSALASADTTTADSIVVFTPDKLQRRDCHLPEVSRIWDIKWVSPQDLVILASIHNDQEGGVSIFTAKVVENGIFIDKTIFYQVDQIKSRIEEARIQWWSKSTSDGLISVLLQDAAGAASERLVGIAFHNGKAEPTLSNEKMPTACSADGRFKVFLDLQKAELVRAGRTVPLYQKFRLRSHADIFQEEGLISIIGSNRLGAGYCDVYDLNGKQKQSFEVGSPLIGSYLQDENNIIMLSGSTLFRGNINTGEVFSIHERGGVERGSKNCGAAFVQGWHVAAEHDGTVSLIDARKHSGGDVITLAFSRTGATQIRLPSFQYATLPSRADSIHFVRDNKVYPFEQFDLRLNRPDIVLERLGAPAEAVAIAKQLREKRLKRMGVTEEMLKPDFHVPEMEIVGDVPTTTDAGEINLAIKASDSKYPLERLKVFVNNVPVNGRNGESLRDGNTQSLERTIPIKLAAGRNKIQVSVLNNAGAESLYANAEVNCTAKRPKPTLYAVAMGVSEYSNPDWNLKYAAKDARDVLAKLKARSGDNYGEVKELLLTDKEVTKENLAQIKDFLSTATIDDTVLMFVAGHGLLDSNYDYYFGTTDIDFNNPADKGIAFEDFDDILADLPCLKKSLLVDTCHAGELDQDEKTLLASADSGGSAALPTGNGIAMRSIGTRGMNVKAIEGARGASEWYDRLQGLFVDLRRGSGSTILSSSAGAEYALESSEQQNGLFTFAVLEALDGKPGADANKDGSVQMSELGEYVKKRVSQLTNNKQTPNTRRVNLEGDFTLAKTK